MAFLSQRGGTCRLYNLRGLGQQTVRQSQNPLALVDNRIVDEIAIQLDRRRALRLSRLQNAATTARAWAISASDGVNTVSQRNLIGMNAELTAESKLLTAPR